MEEKVVRPTMPANDKRNSVASSMVISGISSVSNVDDEGD